MIGIKGSVITLGCFVILTISFYFYVGAYLCHYAPRTFRSPTKTTLA